MSLGSSPFARRYSGNPHAWALNPCVPALAGRCWSLFLPLLRCFSSGGVAPHPLGYGDRDFAFVPARLPHSGIPGSTAAGASPGLIAACHALHRPREPRHPPRALLRIPPAHHNRFLSSHPACQPPGSPPLWSREGSNLRPSHYQCDALPLSYGTASQVAATINVRVCAHKGCQPCSVPALASTFRIRPSQQILNKHRVGWLVDWLGRNGSCPAARSRTATLLRLRPSRRPRLHPPLPCGGLQALPTPMA